MHDSTLKSPPTGRDRKPPSSPAIVAPETKWAACHCQFCAVQLHFPVFREGEILLCPRCGMETMLYGPYSNQLVPRRENYTVEIRSLHCQPGHFGIRYIIGEVVSKSIPDLAWVRIEFKLYNCLDVFVGSASDHLRGFRAGQIWRFKAPVLHKDASRAPLSDVTCEYGSIYHPTTDSCLAGVAWFSSDEALSADTIAGPNPSTPSQLASTSPDRILSMARSRC
jgi:hypothetical protein